MTPELAGSLDKPGLIGGTDGEGDSYLTEYEGKLQSFPKDGSSLGS